MKKTLIWLGLGLLTTVVVLLVVLILWGGGVIKRVVNVVGPQVLKVPISLKTASFQPLRGHILLGGLSVGNPEGFKTRELFNLGSIDIKLNVSSLLSDTLVIQSITIKDPVITYEVGLGKSNIGKFLELLEGERKDKPAAKTETTPKKASGKKVVIDTIDLTGARVKLALVGTGGHAASLPLPPIHLQDVGKEKEGASLTEVIGKVTKAVGDAVASGVGKTFSGLKSVFEGDGKE